MKPEDIADLKQLIGFLKEHQVAEFDLDRGDLKIRLKFTQPASSTAAGDGTAGSCTGSDCANDGACGCASGGSGAC